MKLVQGRAYRGELDLPWYASESMAKDRLQSAGFTEVSIYHVGKKLYAQGRWQESTRDVELPDAIRNVEMIR